MMSLNKSNLDVMKRYPLFFIVIFFIMTSCKKKTVTVTPPLTTTQKIQHRWDLVSVKDFVYIGNTLNLDYINTVFTGTAGDYVLFATDDKAYSNIGGFKDTSNYAVLGDATFVLDGDTNEITTLTETQFVLTRPDRSSATWYDHVTTMSR